MAEQRASPDYGERGAQSYLHALRVADRGKGEEMRGLGGHGWLGRGEGFTRPAPCSLDPGPIARSGGVRSLCFP